MVTTVKRLILAVTVASIASVVLFDSRTYYRETTDVVTATPVVKNGTATDFLKNDDSSTTTTTLLRRSEEELHSSAAVRPPQESSSGRDQIIVHHDKNDEEGKAREEEPAQQQRSVRPRQEENFVVLGDDKPQAAATTTSGEPPSSFNNNMTTTHNDDNDDDPIIIQHTNDALPETEQPEQESDNGATTPATATSLGPPHSDVADGKGQAAPAAKVTTRDHLAKKASSTADEEETASSSGVVVVNSSAAVGGSARQRGGAPPAAAELTRTDDPLPIHNRKKKKSQEEAIIIKAETASSSDISVFSWEQVGNCRRGRRPTGMPKDCCFGGVIRDKCQNFTTGIVGNVNARAREYRKQYPLYFDYSAASEKCDACQIGEYLMKYNLTLTFQGDSMTEQSFVGLRCALLRRGIAKMDDDYVIKWNPHRNATMMWKYGLWDIRVARLIVPETGDYSGRIIYAMAFRRPRQDAVPRKEVTYLVQNSDLIVFDHGSQWQPRLLLQGEFQAEMSQYLEEVTEAQRETGHALSLVAWRETASQHFNLPGGYYWPGKEGKRGCIPHSSVNETLPALAHIFDLLGNALHWPLMKKAAEQAGYGFWNVMEARPTTISSKPQQLAYIPFRDFTAPLHFLHARSDCTNYCNTPYLWHSVWRGLRVAMDGVQFSQSTKRGNGFPPEKASLQQGEPEGPPTEPPPSPASKTAVAAPAQPPTASNSSRGEAATAVADDPEPATAMVDDEQRPPIPATTDKAAAADITASSPLLKSIKKNYSPETYDPLENFEWERPGKCEQRPPNMTAHCCFGGVDVFREFCQPRYPKVIEDLTERDRQYRKEHPDFYKPLADETEPCDACRIADHLIAHNLTLTFQGDSVSDQSFVGLRCALWRRGYKMDWHLYPIWHRNETLFWKYGLKGSRVASLVVDESLPERHPDRTSGRIVYTKVYRRPIQSNYQEVSYMASQSDFLIFDHGLHWQPAQYWSDMLPEMTQMLAEYHETDDLSHLKLLAWRETSTQHWNLPGGYFWPGKQGVGCYDLNNVNRSFPAMDKVMVNYTRDGSTLHVPIMRRAAAANNMAFLNVMDAGFSRRPRKERELVWIPFRNYSIPLWYSHSHSKDCTHYCNSYHLWTSVWRGLRLAVDRAMKQHVPGSKRGGAFDHSPFW